MLFNKQKHNISKQTCSTLKGSVAAVKLVDLTLIDSYLWGLANNTAGRTGIHHLRTSAETLGRQTIVGASQRLCEWC